jgi:hypothetical protein
MTMLTMMKKRVAELEGAQLDWAVVIASGKKPRLYGAGVQFHNPDLDHDLGEPWLHARPSTDWAQGGQIIERERLHIVPAHSKKGPDGWAAFPDSDGADRVQYGETALIASMRAFVSSKLGDEVEVPE